MHIQEVTSRTMRLLISTEDRTETFNASGFLISEEGGIHLYTCWHVVSGVDWHNISPLLPPKRRRWLSLVSQHVEVLPGLTKLGGTHSFEIDLYPQGEPIWEMERTTRPAPDLNAIGIQVPNVIDMVRIPVAFPFDELCFDRSELANFMVTTGDDLLLSGFPYGYSALGEYSPAPVVLKRSLASHRYLSPTVGLLDGAGFEGMSGCPVFAKVGDQYWLYGMYNGRIFPDASLKHKPTDQLAALGYVTTMFGARAFMGLLPS